MQSFPLEENIISLSHPQNTSLPTLIKIDILKVYNKKWDP